MPLRFSVVHLLFLLLARPTACEIQWTDLECRRPNVSHAELFLPANMAGEILALTDATESDPPQIQTNLPIIHDILDQGHPAVSYVRRNLAARIGFPTTHAEPLFVLEYRMGMKTDAGQSMPHYDWTCSGTSPEQVSDDHEELVSCPKSRIVTALVYLRSPQGGGQTSLPRAQPNPLLVPPAVNSAVLWYNLRRSNTTGEWVSDSTAMHHGSELTGGGVKFVAVQWFVLQAYEPPGPDLCEEDPSSCIAAQRLMEATRLEQQLEHGVRSEL